LRKDYLEIQNNPENVSLEKLSFYISQLYLSPRLTEVITEYIRDYWSEIEPIGLNKKIKLYPQSNRLYVVFEQIFELCEVDNPNTEINFLNWANTALEGIKKPLNHEHFFDDSIFNGFNDDAIQFFKNDTSLNSTLLFTKHNFYGKDLFFNKGNPKKLKSA
jgi:hypothetical protein